MLIVLAGLTTSLTASAATELQRLVAVAIKAVSKHKDVRGGLPVGCVLLTEFHIDGRWAEGTLRERHGGKCEGDPGVEPRITTVWVERSTRRVYVANSDGDRVPIERFRPPE